MKRFLRSPSVGIAVVAAVVAALLSGVAIANDEGGEMLLACTTTNNGQLRLVDDLSECRPSEAPVWWSQTGPQGPPGEPGQPGSVEVNYRDPTDGPEYLFSDEGGSGVDVVAWCESDENVVGGGYNIVGPFYVENGTRTNHHRSMVAAVRDEPYIEPTGSQGWLVQLAPVAQFTNLWFGDGTSMKDMTGVNAYVYALCIR